MNISNQAHSLLENYSGSEFGQYLSPTFFDEHFMSTEENAEAKKALVVSALNIISKIGPRGLFMASFREAESFLRDDPTKSAWEGVLELKKWFEMILLDIQKDYFDSQLMSNKVEMRQWESLSLRQRIDSVSNFVENTNSCLDQFEIGEIQLFSIEENEVCLDDRIIFSGLRGPQANKLKEVLFDSIARYLNFSYQSTKIKLVAQ
ncbi:MULTISPECIES: hypothetical protein [unclassified Halobacteriovorax]|uniref:hypothetical protein n=1 Tax=unclassified Halobacteriovorax TaxID=2639665 RepID=UPI000EA3829F|nr:hypothetical protein [Halobacteriovorax sp. BALOs_7]AYF44705.1 hypothetical protein BALOs_1705 [Halobacteriovorax sp. BALOs_7]